MTEAAGSQLVAVCFGAADPAGLARFWAQALRWEVAEATSDGVPLTPTDGTGFTLLFRPLSGDQTSRKRLHLDLTTSSLGDQRGSAEQLVGLGGRHIDIGQTPEEGHLVLADPEGNELCLIGPDNRFLADCPRLGAVCCDGTRAVGVFWSEALGWPLVWDQDEETAVRAPDGTGPMITWGGPPLVPKHGRNRLHLDLAPRPASDPSSEVERLVSLGATRVEERESRSSPGGGRVLLADPDGNELTVRSR
ncbi:VOC family protein [Aquihabitans sp. McL0605]|uniref:VOC family protein n=1 Tax=Aquihabitans sp. McL0605 TaxID=3415671 RepID=UPI003CF12B9D